MRKRGWRKIFCSRCAGHGLVSVYSVGGTDFEGAGECPECVNGELWIRPTGHLFLWPGGPARGMDPKAYAEARKP